MITVYCIKAMCYDRKPLEPATCHQISLTTLNFNTGGRRVSTVIVDRIPYNSFILYPVCLGCPSAPLFAASLNMKFYSFCSRDSPS